MRLSDVLLTALQSQSQNEKGRDGKSLVLVQGALCLAVISLELGKPNKGLDLPQN